MLQIRLAVHNLMVGMSCKPICQVSDKLMPISDTVDPGIIEVHKPPGHNWQSS